MNKKLCFLPLLLLGLIFVSCEETKEPGKYDNWEARNDAFIDSLQQVYDAKTDPELLFLEDSRNKSQKIFFKRMKKVSEGKSPYLTSTVTVFYRGMLINEAVFASASGQKYYTKLHKQLDVFESNFKDADPSVNDSPTKFIVTYTDRSNGWIEAIQWMKPGERWEVYIPWQSGYGTSGYGGALGYSTLIYDIELLSVEY